LKGWTENGLSNFIFWEARANLIRPRHKKALCRESVPLPRRKIQRKDRFLNPEIHSPIMRQRRRKKLTSNHDMVKFTVNVFDFGLYSFAFAFVPHLICTCACTDIDTRDVFSFV